MTKKSYWIWHYGEYEIYHTMMAHLRREGEGCEIPAFWKISTPYVSVKFRKTVISDGGYLLCRMCGSGYALLDGARRDCRRRIELSPGTHEIEICVFNAGGLPAVFIESDVCPSDSTWLCNHFAGDFTPVGLLPQFDSPEKDPQVFPFAYKTVAYETREEVEGGVLFDFGAELFGYLNIEGTPKEGTVGVFYGESREEALDTPHTHLYEYVEGEASYRLRQRAFRYIYLKGEVAAADVSCDFEYLPLERRGSFACEDEIFRKVYDVAAYTFHLNCREGFLDGIKRDRWVWSGDAFQSARINRYLFADREIEERTILGLVGKSPIEQHINTILDYSLLWFLMLDEHYTAYGDLDFVRRVLPMAKELLQFVETRLNADGFLEGLPGDWTFIDWSSIDKSGAVCAEQMLLIAAYRAMARLFAAAAGEGDDLLRKADALTARVRERYWSREKGAFIDSYTSGRCNVTRHANIFAVMFGIANGEETASILENVLKNDEITPITTPYFAGYELDVLASLGELSAVEETIRSYYGGMIALGAKTIWEEYQPKKQGIEHYEMYGRKYEKSLCHAWGAGPIYLFGKYYLGVRPTAPGYKTFEVRPSRGGLQSICGTVPLPDGEVSVSLDATALSVTSTAAGGTLVFGGESYPLLPGKTLTLAL